jgi:uncharacterized protein YceH (UPF0502 family)
VIVNSALTDTEARVLGALIEKEATTPEYYPLTLNALTTACNQKSNRWPVTDYDDRDVLDAITALRPLGFAAEITGGGRVAKYAQRFTEKLNLGRRETAVLCVLLLRGQQTVGEIRTRSERIHAFDDLDEVELVLRKLMEREEGAMVAKLAPAPGMKEPRYAQTLTGVPEAEAAPAHAAVSHSTSMTHGSGVRLDQLEEEVAKLRAEVAELRRLLESVM